MHATRIATFLLGGWIGCCLLVGALSILNIRIAERVLTSPLPQAEEIAKSAGFEQERLLLHHVAAEQYRNYLGDWSLAQIVIALVTLGFVYFGTDRGIFGPILLGLMLVLVLFQYFAIAPEVSFRGRETDFPPGSLAIGSQARRWAIMEVYIGVEAAKLLIGGVLTSYIFAFQSRRRTRRKGDLDEIGRSASLIG